MLTAMYAAENIAGATHDIWNVNVDEEYHEEIRDQKPALGDRLVPRRIEATVTEDMIRSAFARYDPVALGGALGVVLALGLFMATGVLLLRDGSEIAPMLSLLGNYLLGFELSWEGALLGLVEAGIGGFAFGFALARAINAVVGLHEKALRAQIEVWRAQEPLEGSP